MYWYVLVCGSIAFHVLVCTGIYQYVPNSNYQNMVYTCIYSIKELMAFRSGGIDFRSIHAGIRFPRTAQHILVLQVQNDPFSSKLCTKNVYTGTYRYIRSCTHIHKGHNHFLLRIRPYPPETFAIVVLDTYIVHVQALPSAWNLSYRSPRYIPTDTNLFRCRGF
jgi:hypothetical protein